MLVSSAGDLFKPPRPRPGPTKCWYVLGILHSDGIIDFFLNQGMTKLHKKIPSMQRVTAP